MAPLTNLGRLVSMSKRRCRSLSVLLSLVLIVTSPAAFAAKPDHTPGGPPEILPDESQATFQRGNSRVSVETGLALAMRRVDHRVTPGQPEVMAMQFLLERGTELGLGADLSDLTVRATRFSPAGDTIRFQQHVDGVPVYGAEIAVTVDRDANVDFVMNGYKPNARVHTTPRLNAAEARALALGYLETEDIGFERTGLVVYHNRGASRLAWKVELEPVSGPVGSWELLVDANSGQIFRAQNRAVRVNGDGDVFDPDPLSSALAQYGDPGYTDGGDSDTPELVAEIFNRPLLDITFDGTNHNLVGPWAEIRDFENPSTGLFAQPSSSFNFTRVQQGFEAVNTYYHIDTVMRYLNVTLGLNITPYQYNGGVRFDPHGLNGSDNSHYLTGSGQVSFGEGGVDDAEDADVVIHELGHGLHDWVTNGGLSQVNGLSEGVGDFVAQSYSRSFNQWAPADPEYQWVFHWDGHNEFWGGRTTGYGAIYPGGLVGQIHTDGQIWATCNMKIWDLIGRDKTETAFWSGLGMTNGSTNQEEAAQAVLDAAVNLGYSGADVSTIESTYQGCGYNVTAPCSATCGNNVAECGEVCDGTDLGGESCSSQGCLGGTLACNPSCDGYDISSCTDCAVCDNDGVCELGEDCNGCPGDCPGGSTSGAVCGNGICEAGDGEDCVSCSQDCNGRQGGKPSNRFCCGDGDGTNPLPCSDPTCTSSGFSCTDTPVVPGTFCCGDLSCDSGESCSTCALDCTTGAEVCNDGSDNDCDGSTDCDDSDCTGDPACPSCGQRGDACTVDSDCCSNNCKNNGTCR